MQDPNQVNVNDMIALGAPKAVFYNPEQHNSDYADPNIIKVQLFNLDKERSIQTELPAQCQHCLSYHSSEAIENKKWICKFCGHENEMKKEYQTDNDNSKEMDYLIEKPEEKKVETIQISNSESTIVFCIDISGSMSGHPLETVKRAIIQQIETMKETNPKQKVCIVQFENSVQILGDCCHGEIDINEKMLNDFDSLVDIAKERVELFELEKSAPHLIERVKQMRTRGMTALGPATLISTVIAGKESNGQVILCTDGCANMGLRGSLEYSRIADLALEKGVIININTIDGNNANVSEIREMSMRTNGSVIVLNIESIGDAFSDALQNRLIARNATFSVHLSKHVKFWDLDDAIFHNNNRKYTNDRNGLSHIVVQQGNIIDDTFSLMNYKLKNITKRIDSFPVQIVIEFKRLTGEKMIRICNYTIRVAEEGEHVPVNGEIVQSYYIRRVAENKRRGHHNQSRLNIAKFRSAQANFYHDEQSDYKDVIDEYEYGFDREAYDDYYSSKTCGQTMFSGKRMKMDKKYSKQEYKFNHPRQPQQQFLGSPQQQFNHPIPSRQQFFGNPQQQFNHPGQPQQQFNHPIPSRQQFFGNPQQPMIQPIQPIQRKESPPQ